MQRDDITGIFYPGKIGLFGGHREGDETFLDCAVRELHEELGYYTAPERFEFLASYEGPAIQGDTLCVNFFVVRNVPADRLLVSEAKPLLVSSPELGAFEEKLTPTTRYALKALFPKVPRKLRSARLGLPATRLLGLPGARTCACLCVKNPSTFRAPRRSVFNSPTQGKMVFCPGQVRASVRDDPQ
jgi:8-oxo-dGTP diphosphatase